MARGRELEGFGIAFGNAAAANGCYRLRWRLLACTMYVTYEGEPGDDGGGLSLEATSSFFRAAFDPSSGLFSSVRRRPLLLPSTRRGRRATGDG